MKQPLIFLQGQSENIVVKRPFQINLLKPIYTAAAEGYVEKCLLMEIFVKPVRTAMIQTGASDDSITALIGVARVITRWLLSP